MSNPLLSMIIPAYNSSGYIRKALDSVRSQSFTDYELIVVCDSCDDNTEEIAREYGAVTESVIYGLDGFTRNHGIRMAHGQYILFMDDDDWLLHEFAFQMIADKIRETPDADVILFGYIWKDKGYISQTPENISVHCWSKCYKREFLADDIRFSFRHYWSDSDFHNKMMLKPHKFAYIDSPLYYYNFMRDGSTTEKYINRKIKSFGKNDLHIIHSESEVKNLVLQRDRANT